jgi:hypothetical protein
MLLCVWCGLWWWWWWCVCVCVGGGVRVRQAVFLSLSHHNEGDSLPDHQLVPGDTTINHLRLPQPTNKSRADNVIIHVYTSATEHAMHVRSRACTLATHTRTHARTQSVCASRAYRANTLAALLCSAGVTLLTSRCTFSTVCRSAAESFLRSSRNRGIESNDPGPCTNSEPFRPKYLLRRILCVQVPLRFRLGGRPVRRTHAFLNAETAPAGTKTAGRIFERLRTGWRDVAAAPWPGASILAGQSRRRRPARTAASTAAPRPVVPFSTQSRGSVTSSVHPRPPTHRAPLLLLLLLLLRWRRLPARAVA